MNPLVVAHRGASDDLPEHTLAAYDRAIADGVDGVECDVRLTRDGHPVCIHDRRLDRTSDGTGLVSSATLGELERLDFGSWHPRHVPDGSEPAGVLTLEQLILTVLGAGRPLRLLIETKHPSRFGAEVEERVVGLLRRHGLADGDPGAPVLPVVMSFSPLALRRMRALAPAVPTAYLVDFPAPAVRAGALPYGAAVFGPAIGVLRARPDIVRRAHERGGQVYVWTVNTDSDVDLARRAGVDGIITDRPAFVRAHLAR